MRFGEFLETKEDISKLIDNVLTTATLSEEEARSLIEARDKLNRLAMVA
jgi:polyhydroxyalkanoate synthesis regulator phasin